MDLTRARARLRLRALDARDRLRGPRAALVPPRRLEPAGHSEEFVGFEDLVVAVRGG